MKRYRITTLVLLITMGLLANLGYSYVPQLMNYQGRLANASGTPVPDDSYTITLRIYNVATGGAALWAETQNVVTQDGLFSIILGSVNPLNLDFNEDYWLGVQVSPDPEMSPRQRIVSSGYSINTDNLDGQDGTYYTNWSNLTNVPAGFADGVDNEGTGVTDHGALTGLTDDDHTQYLLTDGTRPMAGNLDMGNNYIANLHQLNGGTPWTSANDGPGSTLDADLLDGQDASAFASSTHNHNDSYYTETELNTSDGDAPNSGSNRMHWDNLNGVPVGFADGVDNEGTGVTDHGALAGLGDDDHTQYLLTNGTRPMAGNLDMGNNQITNLHQLNGGTPWTSANDGASSTLDADLLDGQDASAFASSIHNHNDTYYTETELNTSDGSGPNIGLNLMHWDNLNGMPVGFADGVDNVSTGGVTDHGDLIGLGDDDHAQYLLVSGTRQMTGNLNMGDNSITNLNQLNGGTPWTSANDGAGSTLDADLLDGQDASAFASSTHNHNEIYYTETELNTSDGDAPNTGSNRMHWNNLNGVPAGFADGVDNEGAGGVTDHGALTGLGDDDHAQYLLVSGARQMTGNLNMGDNSITNLNQLNGGTPWTSANDGPGSTLDADLLDGQEASAFASSIHNHNDTYYTETELNTSDGDAPNSGSNLMHWDNLNGVPAGFADGVDNEGGVTDHGLLTGLGNDDHPQYLLTNGTRPMAGDLNMEDNSITNLNQLNGGTPWTSANDGSGSTLDADLLDGQDASAFASSTHNHNEIYYTETELNTSDGDAPNIGSNLMHWDNLNGVPAGFADGVDNEGGVTDHGLLTGLGNDDHP
ncbi:MAG: hypothetical protein AB1797_07025, partial [bacterium]